MLGADRKGHLSGLRLALLAAVLCAGVVACGGIDEAEDGASGTDAPGVTAVVPDVVHRTAEYARGMLESWGLTVDIVEVPGAESQIGLVVEQVPAAGTEIALGTSVVLKVAASQGATTAVPSTTTTAAVASSTTQAQEGYSVPVLLFEPPPALAQVIPENGAGSRANGSGCVPGGDEILDGIWFGFVVDYLPSPSPDTNGAVLLDMGCFYAGAAAYDEAAWDDASSVSGIYVRNVVPKTFLVAVMPDAAVYWLDSQIQYQETTFSSWPTGVAGRYVTCPGDGCGVWLYLNGGRVTEIVEQYLP